MDMAQTRSGQNLPLGVQGIHSGRVPSPEQRANWTLRLDQTPHPTGIGDQSHNPAEELDHPTHLPRH